MQRSNVTNVSRKSLDLGVFLQHGYDWRRKGWDMIGTHHAGAVGHMGEGLLRLCLVDEGQDLVSGVVAGVKVRPHHCVNDAGVVGHFGHHPTFHGPHTRLLHCVHDLRLLALRYTSEPNR